MLFRNASKFSATATVYQQHVLGPKSKSDWAPVNVTGEEGKKW